MLFVGIDLAWSNNNTSGIAVIEGNKRAGNPISSAIVLSNEEIINYVNKYVQDKNALIAIDAPLIVPNLEGRRIAEEITGKLFRKYDAGAHPANRKRLSSFTGSIRGEEISRELEKNNFIHSPFLKKFEESRKFFEVYPHPSMVVLFKLNKILQYKAKPKRDYKFRYEAFKNYIKYLKNLKNKKPKLIIPEELFKKDISKMKGQKLKNYEDRLDAIFCSYIAYYSWVFPENCAVLGNIKQGHILTSVTNYMKRQLKNMKKEKQKTL